MSVNPRLFPISNFVRDNYISLDTEFIAIGDRVQLASIGMVKLNGDRFYMLTPDFEGLKERAGQIADTTGDTFLRDTVFNPTVYEAHNPVRASSVVEMRQAVVEFCGPTPVFWMYIGAYDQVALRQGVFGSLIGSPETWPYGFNELGVALKMAGLSTKDFPLQDEERPEHNAVADALVGKRIWEELFINCDGGVRRVLTTVCR